MLWQIHFCCIQNDWFKCVFFFHLLWKNSAECYAFCSAEYRHYIKIMISLLVLGRTAISVQPYKSLNVAVQVDWQESHWKSSSINWVRLWQPEHFLFPHNNMMAHKPTFRGQRKDSNYLKIYTQECPQGEAGDVLTQRERNVDNPCQQNRNLTQAEQLQLISSRAFPLIKHTHAAFTTAGADQRRKSEVSWVCMSVVCVCQRQLSLIYQVAGVSKARVWSVQILVKKARHGHKHGSIFRLPL